ncbi:MAG: FadR family transcriptional regulator [Bacteroidales bacterium]|nr:FadR family transcriptional regulator [Bacteroidales bacterium]MBN2758310.1 FadR family transcriptional regulator [Bacteroidales bacterium]
MNDLFEPIKTDSLKDVFVSKFEQHILSGKLPIGEKLPSERELVNQLKISRSVVHAGLLDLAAKELITIKPGAGATVNDFKKEGSLSILLPLVNYHGLRLQASTQKDILAIRLLFETEAARLSAQNRTDQHLENLLKYISEEDNTEQINPKEIAELDFEFHLVIMEASGNFFFPLLLNSFKPIYLHLVELFYSNTSVYDTVLSFHKELYSAIEQQNETESKKIMTKLLKHGAEHLEQIINKKL